MKQVILNENKLNGLTVYETAPIGSLLAFLGSSAPAGWLLCNQEYELKQSDYPDLYAMVKDFTACQSETTGYFKIPNLSGLVLQGESGNLGEILSAGLPNITGTVLLGDHSFNIGLGDCQGAFYNPSLKSGATISGTTGSGWQGSLGIDASKSNAIYGNSDTVQPPAFTVNYILKATNYVSLPTNAIDDTKATTGNCWSASKVNEKLSYSTEEKVVGEWIDGKPIYRKVYKEASPNTWTTNSVLDTISDFESLVKTEMIAYYSNDGYICNAQVSTLRALARVKINGQIYVQIENMNRSYPITIILEYTKSTD